MISRGSEEREPARAEWIARPVRGADARKVYRCPGCDHEIPAGQPHIVAWRDEWFEGSQGRRHWHTACWRAYQRSGR